MRSASHGLESGVGHGGALVAGRELDDVGLADGWWASGSTAESRRRADLSVVGVVTVDGRLARGGW